MKQWELRGFEAMARGTFENGGQNLYVSRNGVLQRIWRFDVNGDGYVDIPVANSHDYNEHPPLMIIRDPAGRAEIQEVLTQGSQCAAAGDLNGNGYDDLVICSTNDGHHGDLPSYVYFGGPDGITENRKIDLAAPVGSCCAIGDFDGDGRREICYQVATFREERAPEDPRLRVYRQRETGFRMSDFTDLPSDVTYFTAGDIDGDGCDDLYCRTSDGRWLVLWGGPGGISTDRKTEIGSPTDDRARFDLLPFGGGNTRYEEFARPKILRLRGETYLFYADAEKVTLVHMDGKTPDGRDLTLPVRNAVSAAAGHVFGTDDGDLVILTMDGPDAQRVLAFSGAKGYDAPALEFPAVTPRDVLLCDFTGNGRDDIAVAQGRDTVRHTTESLLFLTGADGAVDPEPRRFVTHNCVEVLAARFDGDGLPALVFVNQQESSAYGHIPVYIYLGSENGFSPDRRLEFPGHSAGTILPADFNDDGYTDILVLHNAEDQPFLSPKADLYWGGPEGFSLDRRAQLDAPLAWGGCCADLNRDGYLDVVSCGGGEMRILYGGPDGYTPERTQILDLNEGEPEGTPGYGLWPVAADLNGDGWVEIIVPISGTSSSRIYWGGPEGYSYDRCTKLPVDNGGTVRVADLTKNGYPDLIFGSLLSRYRNAFHEGALTIFWGGPEGYSGFNSCVLPAHQANSVTIADFNGDGWLDIFVSSYINKRERDINSYIYWNDHGRFSLTNRRRMFAHSSSAAWAGDFNEDGYVDLFVSHHRAYGNHRTESAIWWNGPEGFREEDRTWLPTIGPHDMTPNDIGNVMTRGPEEYYVAPPAEAEGWSGIAWEGTIPVKTWVNCQIRTAPAREELETVPFAGPDGTEKTRFGCGEAVPQSLRRGPWFQVKLYLGAVNSGDTPRITAVRAE